MDLAQVQVDVGAGHAALRVQVLQQHRAVDAAGLLPVRSGQVQPSQRDQRRQVARVDRVSGVVLLQRLGNVAFPLGNRAEAEVDARQVFRATTLARALDQRLVQRQRFLQTARVKVQLGQWLQHLQVVGGQAVGTLQDRQRSLGRLQLVYVQATQLQQQLFLLAGVQRLHPLGAYFQQSRNPAEVPTSPGPLLQRLGDIDVGRVGLQRALVVRLGGGITQALAFHATEAIVQLGHLGPAARQTNGALQGGFAARPVVLRLVDAGQRHQRPHVAGVTLKDALQQLLGLLGRLHFDFPDLGGAQQVDHFLVALAGLLRGVGVTNQDLHQVVPLLALLQQPL